MDPQGRFRLSRGNKGTLFVLTKEDRSKKQELLDAITEGAIINHARIFLVVPVL